MEHRTQAISHIENVSFIYIAISISTVQRYAHSHNKPKPIHTAINDISLAVEQDKKDTSTLESIDYVVEWTKL